MSKELRYLVGITASFEDSDPLNYQPGNFNSLGFKCGDPRRKLAATQIFSKYRFKLLYNIPVLWHVKIDTLFDHNNGDKMLIVERELEAFSILDKINEIAVQEIAAARAEGEENPLNKYVTTVFHCTIVDTRNKPLAERLASQLEG